MLVDDVRKAIEGMIGTMTPARAQQVAKGMTEPGAAKEQVAKTAADLLEWSQRNRERLRDVIRHEIENQTKAMGVATQADVDALKKRVRELERAAGMTASGAKRAARASGSGARATVASRAKATTASGSKPTVRAKATGASKPKARKPAAKRSSARTRSTGIAKGEGAQAPADGSSGRNI